MLEDLRANSWSLRPCCMVYRLITECLFGYEIQAAASIGRRFTIHHGVTIGNSGGNDLSSPAIGNGVELGASVTLLGDITIGDNVTIGAGSVVVDSIPDNALVVGEKARVKVIK